MNLFMMLKVIVLTNILKYISKGPSKSDLGIKILGIMDHTKISSKMHIDKTPKVAKINSYCLIAIMSIIYGHS